MSNCLSNCGVTHKKRRNTALLTSGLCLGFAFSVPVYAQTTPDSGVIQQQLEKRKAPTLPDQSPSLAPLPPEMKSSGGLTFTVSKFRFVGNNELDDNLLTIAVEDYLGKPIDFAGLQAAAAAVGETYREAGWLVKAYLPHQEIADGVVTIEIVEAVFGKVYLDGEPKRYSEERIKSVVEKDQTKGKIFNARALDRRLLLLDDFPGVSVSGNLKPGANQAETDLVLKIADEPLVNGTLGLDNTGSRTTGKERGTMNVFVNSPAGIGDLITSDVILSRGTKYGRLGYSLPIGDDGLRVGANSSYLSYNVITPEFASLDLNGHSKSFGANLEYPIIRSGKRNLYVSGGFERKAYRNSSLSSVNSEYGIDNLYVNVTGNLFDRFGGGGANMASLTLTHGDLDLGVVDSNENSELDGRFTKLRYSLSRQQALVEDLSVFTSLSGQFAGKNLDSAEKFYLGGANGVRAYPANEGGGSEGHMINAELRYRWNKDLVLTGFYDWGRVIVNEDNSITSPAAPNNFNLKGAGVSASWVGPGNANLVATYARRIGSNPNPTSSGYDQDGSKKVHRFWLALKVPF
ncbi:ShlB/FhaC/HecB family hemolysin secretion/activation protein [Terasakiella sp. SH-1]|uniref:ShlB/FhaC/HecB family hemolysin secretion/activation protein n=1 Tax=Terasakiella sp. SH-1 TaxID=2560057 RepID=UPI001074211C|nr:ShlB/FhaC/HecB family hemolysin secretion/activation protein [Terasakiella sp. SH-1]